MAHSLLTRQQTQRIMVRGQNNNEVNTMKRAFTILELVIVVAIISVMATMLLTTLSTFKNKYADVDVTQLDELENQYNEGRKFIILNKI